MSQLVCFLNEVELNLYAFVLDLLVEKMLSNLA